MNDRTTKIIAVGVVIIGMAIVMLWGAQLFGGEGCFSGRAC